MAIDTRDKRSSVSGLGFPGTLVPPLADGSVDTPDRAHLAGLYAGLTYSAPADVTLADVYAQVQALTTLVETLLLGRYDTDPVTGLAKVYDTGGTLAYQAGIYADVDGAEPYDGTNGIQRRDLFSAP